MSIPNTLFISEIDVVFHPNYHIIPGIAVKHISCSIPILKNLIATDINVTGTAIPAGLQGVMYIIRQSI